MVNRYWSVSSDFHFLDDSLTPQHPRMLLACVLCKVRRCGVVWNFDEIFIRFWGGVIRSAFRVVWWTECLLLTTLFINKIGFLPPSIAIRTVILVVSAVIEYLHFGSIFRVLSLFCFSSKYLYRIVHTHSQLSLPFCVFAKIAACKNCLWQDPPPARQMIASNIPLAIWAFTFGPHVSPCFWSCWFSWFFFLPRESQRNQRERHCFLFGADNLLKMFGLFGARQLALVLYWLQFQHSTVFGRLAMLP